MSWVPDWIYNSATGELSPSQVDAIRSQVSADVLRAGGTQSQASAAATQATSEPVIGSTDWLAGIRSSFSALTSGLKWIVVALIVVAAIFIAREFRRA